MTKLRVLSSLLFCLFFASTYAYSCSIEMKPIKTDRIVGVVKDDKGRMIAGSSIKVFDAPDPKSRKLAAETVTDVTGRFVITTVPPGKRFLVASAQDFSTVETPFTLTKRVMKYDRDDEIAIYLAEKSSQCGSYAAMQDSTREARKYAERVKAEFLHAWNGYKKYAWGNDDLLPLSKKPKNWHKETLLMTAVDSLSTIYLMGMKAEGDATRKYITENLSFDKDIEVQNFEITIRILGGLLSAHQMTGDKKLLALADDLGMRLLPVFESKTGLPYRYVNFKTGKTRDAVSNPAETGTLLIEFGTLSKLTNKPIYYEKAKRALVETYKRRSPIGLVGKNINVETGEWTNTTSHVGAEIDSYYEYLLKCWLLFGDQDCKKMWDESIVAVNKYLADEVRDKELWYGHADMNTGKRTRTTYGALDAFFPGVLALGGDLDRAKRLQDSGFKMWNENGIEPEAFNYQTMKVEHAGYPLRPEIIESTYILYHYTKDPKYQAMGKKMFEDFVRHARTDEAYASLKNVITKEKADTMHSFLLAETFKYFYLLFAPEKTLDYKKVIFNTEAHPIKKTWK